VLKAKAHASPSIRRLARELGVDLAAVKGTGRHSRILELDVKSYVKENVGKTAPAAGGFVLPELPFVDYARFGLIESQPLSRIKRVTGANLHRAWLRVVHVTQHDEADITDLDSFRKAEAEEAKKRNVKLTMLPFIMKAVVAALKAFPTFNASLDASGENLILKRYYHLGIAVDTPEGLVVPVIRDVDRKGVYDLATELAGVSEKARARKLMPGDLQGGSFTISSLGGIGGTLFTPIVNAPEVAILGVSRASMKPVFESGAFVPRLVLPLSLSYDHRVNDGADAARFTTYLRQLLSDIKRLLL
jgi:pyruvate dehydrogenase E2 component (dihydrolipoamide acetyltransferase)